MIIRLDIGPEMPQRPEDLPEVSQHILSVKSVDDVKREAARQDATLDMKAEIKGKSGHPGRISIIGELPASKQGLGRLPMIASALLMIFFLNFGQLVFLGKDQGGEALALATEAFTSLKDASQSVISGGEGADLLLFQEASELFTEAEQKGKFLLKHQSEWLPEPKQVQSLRNLLDAGRLMADVGQHIGMARLAFSEIPDDGSLTDFIRKTSESDLEPAAHKLHEINELLDQVDLSGTDYLQEFLSFREKLSTLSSMMDTWLQAKDPVLTLLGDRYPQRYLVLLMNNDEMRPGGGFIGSYLLVDINDGRLENFTFHDIYELDNLFYDEIEVPIHELRPLTKYWRMRDSNIYPDFPSTAKQAAWFLEAEGGPGVDGVVAVNLSTAQSLLEEIGSLHIDSLNKDITAETLPAVLSTLIEAKTYGKQSPKEVLRELIDAFVDSADTMNERTALAMKLFEEAQKKQVMVYHKDPRVQSLIEDFELDGSLPKLSEVEGDFFMPIFTNIGANNTDRYMNTNIRHNTHVFDDGTIVDSVTIERSHTFTDATLAWLKKTTADFGFSQWNSDLEGLLGAEANRTGIRLYIPEGSILMDTQGILRDEVQLYYDKTQDLSYYYVDQTVAPGQSESFTIMYGLPWTFRGKFKEHDFHLYKQPGLKSVRFEKTVDAPDSMLLSSIPLASENREDIDFTLAGPLHNDVAVKLLYR